MIDSFIRKSGLCALELPFMGHISLILCNTKGYVWANYPFIALKRKLFAQLKQYAMYPFCKEKVDTFECVAKEWENFSMS